MAHLFLCPFQPPLPRTLLARSAVVSIIRACWLASAPLTGEYVRKAWRRTTTTMTIQTQTPAPRGRTLTARAAPSPDCLRGAGLKPRPRTEDKGTFFCFVCSGGTKSQRRMRRLCFRVKNWILASVLWMLQREIEKMVATILTCE